MLAIFPAKPITSDIICSMSDSPFPTQANSPPPFTPYLIWHRKTAERKPTALFSLGQI